MTTALSVTGIVIDRDHKDGETNGKKWDRYGFQIAGPDGKHWYSSFDKAAWDALEKGKAFQVFYSEKENSRGGPPLRNLEWWKAVDLDEATESQVKDVAQSTTNHDARIAWNSAVNNAVALLQGTYDHAWQYADTIPVTLHDEILVLAVGIYDIITQGPPDALESPVETPAEPEPPQRPEEGSGLFCFAHQMDLKTVPGDSDTRAKHPVRINRGGRQEFDRWCYGE